jgi:hypothetical protein
MDIVLSHPAATTAHHPIPDPEIRLFAAVLHESLMALSGMSAVLLNPFNSFASYGRSTRSLLIAPGWTALYQGGSLE